MGIIQMGMILGATMGLVAASLVDLSRPIMETGSGWFIVMVRTFAIAARKSVGTHGMVSVG